MQQDVVEEVVVGHNDDSDAVKGFWGTSDTTLDLGDGGFGEFFSYLDVQECVALSGDSPSLVMTMPSSSDSNTSTSGTYADLEALSSLSPHTTSSSNVSDSPTAATATGATTKWPAEFVQLESSTIRIQGNVVMESPKNSKDSIQVQVPPLPFPIIRSLEDNLKKNGSEKVERPDMKKKREYRKRVDGKTGAKTKQKQPPAKKGRNLEKEFETNVEEVRPTLTVHHRADVEIIEDISKNAASMDFQQQSKNLQQLLYGGGNIVGAFPGLAQNENTSGVEMFSAHNTNNGNRVTSFVPMNSYDHQQGQKQVQKVQHPNSQMPPYFDPFQTVSQQTLSNRVAQQHWTTGGGHAPPSRCSSPAAAGQQPAMMNQMQQQHQKHIRGSLETDWKSACLSPVERLFRTKISEVNEGTQRNADVQIFMKNSQLYNQLLEPVKIKEKHPTDNYNCNFAGKHGGGGGNCSNHCCDQHYRPHGMAAGYNGWPMMPIAKTSSMMKECKQEQGAESMANPFNCNPHAKIPAPYQAAPPPYENSCDIKSNSSQHPMDKKSQQDWLRMQSIPKDYNAMINEITRLRFQVVSERRRSELYQLENSNLRRLLALESSHGSGLRRNAAAFKPRGWPSDDQCDANTRFNNTNNNKAYGDNYMGGNGHGFGDYFDAGNYDFVQNN